MSTRFRNGKSSGSGGWRCQCEGWSRWSQYAWRRSRCSGSGGIRKRDGRGGRRGRLEQETGIVQDVNDITCVNMLSDGSTEVDTVKSIGGGIPKDLKGGGLL